jgi:cytochrome c oxidase cbb3-type subunit 4
MPHVMPLLHSLWVVWAVLLFAAIAFWAFRPKNRRRFEADAEIPLRDDREEGSRR